MEFEQRWYQLECVNSLLDDILYSDNKYNPIAVIPTGGGKSIVLCLTADEYLTEKPDKDILVISHVDGILEQNYTKLRNYFTEEFIGLYSAGLGEKVKKKITVAGIQSIYKKPELFKNIGLIIIDECHLVNSEEKGMYRSFINELKKYAEFVVAGLTATPYRTTQGWLHKSYPGTKNIFNKISYDLSSYENYNKLIDEGHLVKIIPAPTKYKMDTEGISKNAGDWVVDELSAKFNRDEITNIILDEIIKYARDKYKKWLIFAIDKVHVLAIKELLLKKGIPCEAVYSGMKLDKKQVVDDFRKGKYKALININMLTTGIDIPEIDLIAHLRPSESPIYHVQSNGRGARPAPWINKTHCLVLDFAGNTQRHGPVNDVRIDEPGKKIKGNYKQINTKKCKNCGTENSLRAKFCIACDEDFEINHKLSASASTGDLVKTGQKKIFPAIWLKVKSVDYSIHQKAGSPSSLRVIYKCGMQSFSEWICIDHSNHYIKGIAFNWVKKRLPKGYVNYPKNLGELFSVRGDLKIPSEIKVDTNEKFVKIIDYKFENIVQQKFENNLQKMSSVENHFDDDIPF